MGVLRTLYPEFADDLLKSKNYRMRKDDILSRVDPRINDLSFSLHYAKRDMDVLDLSKSSLMIGYLHKLIEKMQTVISGNNPVVTDLKLVINLYPYDVTDDQARLIGLAISTAIGLTDTVDTVSMRTEDVTLDFLECNNFMAYVCYDFNAWVTATLPDKQAGDLSQLGLRRYENLTIFAAKLAIDASGEDALRSEFAEYGMGDMYDEMLVMPWNMIFELELIDSIYFTEFDKELSEHLMSFVEKSNSPIDLEVGLISDFYHIMENVSTTTATRAHICKRMAEVAAELARLTTSIDASEFNLLRTLLAEQRFLVDSLSVLVPSQPALDFERFMDSTMSNFDINQENSDISENRWNSLGVRCRRLRRKIRSFDTEVFVLVTAEDCTDLDGVFRAKNTLLPSVMSFEAVLEPMPEAEIDEFMHSLGENN